MQSLNFPTSYLWPWGGRGVDTHTHAHTLTYESDFKKLGVHRPAYARLNTPVVLQN